MMPPVRPPFRYLALALLTAAAVLVPGTGWALHRDLPYLLSVTPVPGDNVNAAPARGQPHWIAFESTADVMHNGSTGREIFVYNSLEDVINGSPVLGQVTNFTRDSGNPSVAEQGSVLAFDSAADILGNGNAVRQIFLWERRTGIFRQLTSGTGTSRKPMLDFQARALAFESTADLLHRGSTGNQIFVYNLLSAASAAPLTQVTNDPTGAFNPHISHNGNIVVFESAAPLTGPSNGFRQIFAYDRTTRVTKRLTNGAGDSTLPTTDDDGRRVAFQSQADLLNNGSTGTQIFVMDRLTNELRQITNGPGDCFAPSIGRYDEFVSFLSTGDLLGTGATGTHVFFFDPRSGLTFQVTRQPGALAESVVSSGGNFITFVTNEDLFATGVAGRQTYLLNTWERIPKPFIGDRKLLLVPGDGTLGSRVRAVTQDWTAAGGVPVNGQITLAIGNRDFNAEAPINVATSDVRFPPTAIPGFGTLCVAPTAKGQGVYDCDGGRLGNDLLVTQDHDITDTDPGCVQGCAEGQLCQGVLPGPHVGACNENPRVEHVNPGQPGGLQVRLPVRLSVARQPGVDGQYCTADDDYAWRDHATVLEFTTGAATATIFDADNTPGANLSVTETGSAFECRRIEQGNLAGGSLVSVLPLLDLPNTPVGLRDVILGFRLEPYEGKPYVPCTGLFCSVLTHCDSDVQCNDGNICNGYETCFANGCIPGPLVCDDGNACNGTELCDPLIGCIPGIPPTCDDGAACTADTCDVISGCVHRSISGCCAADADCADADACNGPETCVLGDCVPSGAVLTCDDGDACNGTETCNGMLGCLAGTPPVCDDGAACTADSCDAVLGCTHTSISGCCTSDADCIDNEACNGDEQCLAGDCVPGTPPVCDDGALCTYDVCDTVVGCLSTPIGDCCVSDADCVDNDACNGSETCVAGVCVPGTVPDCDDGAACTADVCIPSVGCVSTNIPGCCSGDADCINNSVCDGVEACVAGDCIAGAALTCDDGDFCNGNETCDKLLGCQAGTPFNCDDGAACTLDVCDLVQGCVSTSVSGCCLSDADCLNNNPCDGTETCVAGDCVAGTPLVCDDGNPCTGVETCDPGVGCVAGVSADCDDGIVCTADSCDAVLGCVHTPIVGCCQTDDDCGDNDACNGTEMCDFTATCQFGGAPSPYSLAGIKCQLATLQSTLGTATAGTLGPTRTMARLTHMLTRVTAALSPVNSRGRPKRIGSQVAARLMGRFAKTLDRSVSRGEAGDFEFAETLADSARAIQQNLLQFRVGAPQG